MHIDLVLAQCCLVEKWLIPRKHIEFGFHMGDRHPFYFMLEVRVSDFE